MSPTNPSRGYTPLEDAQVTTRATRITALLAMPLLLATLVLSALAGPGTAFASHDPYLLGVKAFEQGHMSEALQYFREASRLHPRDALVANALGNVWFALNETSKATEEYRRAIRLDPQLAAAHKNLGILQYDQGEFQQAEHALEASTRLSPRDPVAWRFLGLALASSGRASQAIAPLRRSLDLVPQDSPTRLSLAASEADAGRRDAALADYRVIVRDASLDLRSQKALGIALLALDDPESAAVQLAFTARHSPPDDDLETSLARAQLAAHRPEDARKTLETALAAAKDKGAIYKLLGLVEQQTHDPTGAAREYAKAIAADAKDSQPYLQLSWLYAEHRHFGEAEQTLSEGLRFVQDTYPLTVQLGTVLVLAGREREAVPILEQAVASQPRNPLGYTTLIIADAMLDPSYQQPLRTAEAALQNCPDNYLVHYLYAGLLLRQHRESLAQPGVRNTLERIKSELKESIRLNPDFPHSHYDLARLEYEAHDFVPAEGEALAALKADREFSSARYLLGRIHLKEGRKEQGLAEIAQVDREHREEMQRIQSMGESLLAAQAAAMGSNTQNPHTNINASPDISR